MPLRINTKAPDFSLPSTSGEQFTLSETMKGKPCVLYFYPKDFTPGCTTEACSFRDEYELFSGLDIAVFGISRDSIGSHKDFKTRHHLPFELLSDTSGKVCKQYDALIPLLKMPKRVSYLLDKDHKIVAVYENMFDGQAHLNAMIAELKAA